MNIILASASPRRKELLSQIGAKFSIIKSDVTEVVTKTAPADVVQELSLQKAMDVATKLIEAPLANDGFNSKIVIGSDTIVAVDDQILGKPSDREEAYEMINSIQGRTHQVYTGVAIVEVPAIAQLGVSELIVFADVTDVEVYPMTAAQIEEYISTEEPYDKAGAYGIQGLFGKYVKGIKGDYNTVVGLPVARIYQELKKMGIDITEKE